MAFFLPPHVFWDPDPGSGIRDGKNPDPGSGIRDKHPGSATLEQTEVICLQTNKTDFPIYGN